MTQYESIRKNIIYEEKIFAKKNGKQFLGCLVKSKYADQSDQIKFYLFENKPTKDFHLCLDLIDYNKCREQKKDPTWRPTPFQKTLFYLELIPKHQQINQIFGTETEEYRTKWIEIFNKNIDELNTNSSYEIPPHLADEKSSGDEEEKQPRSSIEFKPMVPPRKFDLKELKDKIAKSDSSNHVAMKENPLFQLRDDDIFYEGSIEELQKILSKINKPGVYAVSAKVHPESDCTRAIRAYENIDQPLSSWNIYEKQGNKYFLFDDGPTFSSILKLCEYYTIHSLPKETSFLDRLISPYKHNLK